MLIRVHCTRHSYSGVLEHLTPLIFVAWNDMPFWPKNGQNIFLGSNQTTIIIGDVGNTVSDTLCL